MRRAVLLACAALAGCAVDPDELLTYSGSVLTADRSGPMAGQTVELLRSDDLYCTHLLPYRELTTDADGGWSTQLYRGELANAFEDRFGRCIEFGTTFSSGARTRMRLTRLVQTTRLPPFFEWVTSLELVDGGVDFTPIETAEREAELDTESGYFNAGVTHEASLTIQGRTILNVSDVSSTAVTDAGETVIRTPIALPGWAYEGFDADISVVAKEVHRVDVTPAGVTSDDREFEVVTFTPVSRVQVAAGPPPVSRGASCPPFVDPCPLTDGLVLPLDLGLADGGIDFELPRAASVRRVVFHGMGIFTDVGGASVELHDDAGTLLGVVSPVLDVVQNTLTLSDHTPPGESSSGLQQAWSWQLPPTTPAASRVLLRFPYPLYGQGEVSLLESL